MHRYIAAVILTTAAIFIGDLSAIESQDDSGTHLGKWLVGITGDIEVAKKIAEKEGFMDVEEIPELKLFHLYNLRSEDKRSAEEITENLQAYNEVLLARQVLEKKHVSDKDEFNFFQLMQNNDPSPHYDQIEPQGYEDPYDVLQSYKTGGSGKRTNFAPSQEYYCAGPKMMTVLTNKPLYCDKDPGYSQQWYWVGNRGNSDIANKPSIMNLKLETLNRSCDEILYNTPSPHGLKIIQTWRDFGVSGRGVKVLVQDKGVQSDHLDLMDSLSLEYSYDFISDKNDPSPVYAEDNHGTLCAGIIAMKKDNGICGVGVAPGVTLGGIRNYQTNGNTITIDEIKTTIFKAKEIDIIVDAHSQTVEKAFEEMEELLEGAYKYSVEEGRGGKGVLHIVSTGNSKGEDQVCSSNFKATTIYTIAIGGVEADGSASAYAEACSSVMAVTYSGSGAPFTIYTTDVGPSRDKCSEDFNGTSASCPMAGGLIALVLEANPNLTWRDVKHLLTWTSEVAAMAKNGGFIKNARGFYTHLDFGFGLINVYDMVEQAITFKTVPPLHSCVVKHTLAENEKSFSRTQAAAIIISAKGCRNQPQAVNYVEDVQIRISMEYQPRGAIQIALISPSETRVPILEPRKRDLSNIPIHFTFHSAFHWGEDPNGDWVVEIFDEISSGGTEGVINSIEFVIHGTAEMPDHYKKGNRKYLPSSLN